MKRLIIWVSFLFQFFIIGNIYAQKIGKVIKRTAQQKTEQKASQATGNAIDEGIKSIFKKKDKNTGEDEDTKVPEEQANNDTVLPKADIAGFGVYTKFTFEPGNKIVYFDDFSKDKLGDFPLHWETNSGGEVVTNSLYKGNWFSVSGRAGYLPLTDELPENYTIEFDLVTNGLTKNNSATALTLNFLNKKAYASGAAGGYAYFKIGMSTSAGMLTGNTGAEKTPRIQSALNRKFKVDMLVHFSIAVNKNRLRIWMEEEKVADIPSLLVGNMGRYLLFETYGVNQERGHVVLLSNFKIAEAAEDMRSQLLDKGRFSTTGIYFNTDKAFIKPESYAIIKSVADYLKENPAVNIRIIGHTDAQGEADYNLQLSERRAQAVKQALITLFQIEESRMSTVGKGESEPVAENTTPEGKANNRRVEFIKI